MSYREDLGTEYARKLEELHLEEQLIHKEELEAEGLLDNDAPSMAANEVRLPDCTPCTSRHSSHPVKLVAASQGPPAAGCSYLSSFSFRQRTNPAILKAPKLRSKHFLCHLNLVPPQVTLSSVLACPGRLSACWLCPACCPQPCFAWQPQALTKHVRTCRAPRR